MNNARPPQKTQRLRTAAFSLIKFMHVKTSSPAFTLFELLAVLTVISIGLVVLVGSYGSWGTAHALEGATRTLEAGLQQARTQAMTHRTYVAFCYGSTNSQSSQITFTTGFQSSHCTNTIPPVSEVQLKNLVLQYNNNAFLPTQDTLSNGSLVVEPATPFQRLSGHVRLSRRTTATSGPVYTPSIVIFRPDGSIMTDDGITLPSDPSHYIAIQTVESYSISQTEAAPLVRLLRIDPTTGLVTVIKPGVTP